MTVHKNGSVHLIVTTKKKKYSAFVDLPGKIETYMYISLRRVTCFFSII